MPSHIYNNLFMTLNRSIVLACLPIPKPQFTPWIPRTKKLPIRWELHSTRIPHILMSCKSFLPIKFKSILQVIHHYRVIHWLSYPVFPIRMYFGCWNRIHIRFKCVLNHNRNTKMPSTYFLFICGGDKTFTFIKESYCIYTSCMFSLVF